MSCEENVVLRLKRRISDARAKGFKVRMEMLEGEQATWCEIAGVPTLFVDLSQTAAEQLQQLEETLTACGSCRSPVDSEPMPIEPPPQMDDDLANRAA